MYNNHSVLVAVVVISRHIKPRAKLKRKLGRVTPSYKMNKINLHWPKAFTYHGNKLTRIPFHSFNKICFNSIKIMRIYSNCCYLSGYHLSNRRLNNDFIQMDLNYLVLPDFGENTTLKTTYTC